VLAALIRRVGSVAIGTAVGQGLVLLVTPYLARHYSPEAFGTLALLMTVSNISTAVACLRYDLALPAAETPDTRGLLITALTVACAIGVLGFVLLATLSNSFLTAQVGVLAQQPILVGTCICFVGFFQATTAWFLRRGAFRAVALMRLSQGAWFSVFAVIPCVGLLWAHVLSFGAGLLGLRLALVPRKTTDVAWHEVALRYRHFPAVSLPGALLDVSGYSICIWVIATFYGQGTAGNYSQIQRLAGAPLMLMSISLGQILLKQTADLSSDRVALRRFLTRILRLMAALAVAGLVFLWFFGEPIVANLLGPQWNVNRRFLILVAIAVFVRACVSPLSAVLITLRRLGICLTWQALYFCSALLLMPLIAAWTKFEYFIFFYALHECVFYGFYLTLIYRTMRLEGRRI